MRAVHATTQTVRMREFFLWQVEPLRGTPGRQMTHHRSWKVRHT